MHLASASGVSSTVGPDVSSPALSFVVPGAALVICSLGGGDSTSLAVTLQDVAAADFEQVYKALADSCSMDSTDK